MTEKKYHIYARKKCIYHSLNEEEFANIWKTLNYFVEIATDLDKEELEYEEVVVEKYISAISSY